MCFRAVMHVIYLKKNILYRPVFKWFKGIATAFISGAVGILLVKAFIKIPIGNYLEWFAYAVVSALVIGLTVCAFFFAVYHKTIIAAIKSYSKRNKKETQNESRSGECR